MPSACEHTNNELETSSPVFSTTMSCNAIHKSIKFHLKTITPPNFFVEPSCKHVLAFFWEYLLQWRPTVLPSTWKISPHTLPECHSNPLSLPDLLLSAVSAAVLLIPPTAHPHPNHTKKLSVPLAVLVLQLGHPWSISSGLSENFGTEEPSFWIPVAFR